MIPVLNSALLPLLLVGMFAPAPMLYRPPPFPLPEKVTDADVTCLFDDYEFKI